MGGTQQRMNCRPLHPLPHPPLRPNREQQAGVPFPGRGAHHSRAAVSSPATAGTSFKITGLQACTHSALDDVWDSVMSHRWLISVCGHQHAR